MIVAGRADIELKKASRGRTKPILTKDDHTREAHGRQDGRPEATPAPLQINSICI